MIELLTVKKNTFFLYGLMGIAVTQLTFGLFHVPVKLWVIWVISVIGSTLCIRHAANCRNKQTLLYTGILSIAMATMFLLGSRFTVDPPNFAGITVGDIPFWLGLVFLLWAVFVSVFDTLTDCNFAWADKPLRQNKSAHFASWALWTILPAVAWFPYWLAYYPGMMTGDSFSCLVRAAGWTPINNQQPVFYQLYLGFFLRVGDLAKSINRAVALYSIVQLLLMASVLGYACYWCRKQGCSRLYLMVVVLFFSFNPIYAQYSITMWKDVLFGGAMLLFSLFIFDTAKQHAENLKNRGAIAHLCLLSLAVAFLRNNGIYVLICTFAVLALFFRRFWKQIIPVTLILLIFIAAVQGPVYNVLKIPNGNFAESLGVPLQQAARVVAKDGKMTAEQKEFLNQLLPLDEMKNAYSPYTTDKVKFHKDFDNSFLEANKAGFFKVWAGMLLPNLKEYVIGYLMLTLGYWNIGTTNWVTATGITAWSKDTYGIVPYNLLKGATGFDLKPYAVNMNLVLTEFPLTAMLNNIAVMVWVVFFLILFALARRRFTQMISLVPLIALWLTTMLATPTYCEFRYMFSFFLSVPFLIFAVLSSQPKSAKA